MFTGCLVNEDGTWTFIVLSMSIDLPRWRGDAAVSTALNTLADAIEAVGNKRIVTGPNMTFIEDEGSIIFDTNLTSGLGGNTRYPWDLLVKPDPESTQDNPPYKVTVMPGLVAGMLPTNWDQEWTFGAEDDSVKYAKVKLITDGHVITAATIALDGTKPKVPKPEKWKVASDYEFIFGIYKSASVYRTITYGDILKRPVRWMITQNDDNEYIPYDIWYSLSW